MKGCFMSARREAATTVRFDEQLTGYALAEDEDFSYRLSRLGRIRYAPEIVVQHRKLGFGAQDPRRLGRLVVVNRAYLFRKNFSRNCAGEGAVRPVRGDARGPPAREPAVARGPGRPGRGEGRLAWQARRRSERWRGYPRPRQGAPQGGPKLTEQKR